MSYNQLSFPYTKDDNISIIIPKEEHRVGLDACKKYFHDMVILIKGDAPMKIESLPAKLASLWEPLGR